MAPVMGQGHRRGGRCWSSSVRKERNSTYFRRPMGRNVPGMITTDRAPNRLPPNRVLTERAHGVLRGREAPMVTEHLTQKQDGTWWRVLYPGGTIQWVPLPGLPGDSDAGGRPPSPRLAGMGPFGGGLGPLQALTSVAQVASTIVETMELRQQRLMVEAAHEQSQRIEWLTEMMGRWAEVHRSGGQLDLRVSEYLVREVRGVMEAVTTNKRVALPQSLLYDLELILDSFRSMRLLLSSQFEELTEKEGLRLKEAVQTVLPGHGLDIDFVRRLALDPSDVWTAKLRGKAAAGFDEEFAQAFRFPDVFRDRLFPVNEVAVREVNDPSPRGFLDRIAALVAGPLLWLRWDDFKADSTDKRDTYRELLILPAEFFRVRALNSAWVATSAVVGEAFGQDLDVLIGADGITVQIGTSDAPALTGALRAALAVNV